MKKKHVKILIITICMVSVFSINAYAWTATQPDQGYLPFIMEDTGTELFQMMPYGTFSIAKDTFPTNQNPADIDNLVMAQFYSFTVIWANEAESGSYEGVVQLYGETYTAEEANGFQLAVYDWWETDDAYVLNFGILELANSDWVFNPEDYTDVDGVAYENAYRVPVCFYAPNISVAESGYNLELAYWALQHYPISIPYFEQTQNPVYNIGYRDGKSAAEKSIFNDGKEAGYNEAAIIEYNRGFNAGLQQGDEATFASLIFAVIDTPISILTQMLDFEILGTNMTSFVYQMVSALFFLAIVKVIIKVLI